MDETSTTDLVDLVRRAQRGDEEALHDLIVTYQNRVAGFVFAITNRRDQVEDLSQQVFIKMVRAIGGLQAPSQFESWLFRLARNTCIDQLRRQKLRRIFLPFAAEHENIPEPPGAVDTEELDALRHALEHLRPQDRALLARGEVAERRGQFGADRHGHLRRCGGRRRAAGCVRSRTSRSGPSPGRNPRTLCPGQKP